MKIKTYLKSLSALILLAGLIPVAFAADEAKPSATVVDDGNRLGGYWGSAGSGDSGGKWNLTRIE